MRNIDTRLIFTPNTFKRFNSLNHELINYIHQSGASSLTILFNFHQRFSKDSDLYTLWLQQIQFFFIARQNFPFLKQVLLYHTFHTQWQFKMLHIKKLHKNLTHLKHSYLGLYVTLSVEKKVFLVIFCVTNQVKRSPK